MSAKQELRELVDRLGEERADELLPYLRKLLGDGEVPVEVVAARAGYGDAARRSASATPERDEDDEANRLYERYGKPLEAEHWGEYVAISPQGEVVLAPTLVDAMQRATETLGRGNSIFKVGERGVGGWGSRTARSPSRS